MPDQNYPYVPLCFVADLEIRVVITPLGDLSLYKVKTIYNCQPERLTSQSKRLTATELSALELTAPSWSLKGFNVTNDAKGFILHRYLQSGDIIGFGIYRFYRRNKKVIKCVIRATFILSAPEQEQLPSGNSSCFGADKMTVALIPIW